MIQETSRALYGVWLFARLDPTAEALFGNSLAAARRSFVVAVIMAPLFALQAFIDFDGTPLADPWIYGVVQALSYVILWTAWPVLMATLAPALGRADRYGVYIAASNWFVLAEFAILFPLTILESASLLPEAAVAEAQQMIQIGLMLYEWFIARNTLKISATMAAALVLIEFLLTVLIAVSARALLQGGPP